MADARREEFGVTETKWLIAREIPRLRRYALTLVGDPVAADDLVQDTLERAMRKHHLWARRASVRTWLFRMQYNLYLNQRGRRWKRSREIGIEEVGDVGVCAGQDYAMACRDIVEAMSRLPPEQRAAIALTAVEGLSYDEASAALRIPLGTLRSRLSRGRERLRAIFPVTEQETRLRRVK